MTRPLWRSMLAIGLLVLVPRLGFPLSDERQAPSVVPQTNSVAREWVYRAPTRPNLPSVRNSGRVRTPIDAFLLARLEAKNLTFNPDAEKTTLLRRLCFDLLGLPPTPEQIREFLRDTRPNAYEWLVDRLLDSPRYGERWARHWLDVAGYADSDGYLAADRLRPEAWRYRDYVIRAHNEDLPFNQFVVEQLAGDELSDWRRADELTPAMERQLVATGLLRTASDPTYPGYIEPNEVHQVISDTIQIVGSAFIGLTIQCARCHDHKQDPLTQSDYYALRAVFLPALDPARWQPSEVRGIPLASDAERARVAEQNAQIDARVATLTTQLGNLTARYRRKSVVARLSGLAPIPQPDVLDKLAAAVFTPADRRTAEQVKLSHELAAGLSLNDVELPARHEGFKRESEQIRSAIAAETSLKKAFPLVRGLHDLDDRPPQARILERGDYTRLGAAVEPAMPRVFAVSGARFETQPAYKTTGRRLAFARWLTDPAHPTFARVQVNRIWARHFGRGLVATTANFGQAGAEPTHPELLDWLATEFIRQGWSMKAMHRLMVCSTAYRQTSDFEATRARVDPDNLLLGAWQPRRHDGEVVRDSLLAVAGKLELQMYGPPAAVAPQADGSILTQDDAQGNRRSIYVIVRRSQHLTMLELFDTPLMEINCPERTVSTVPLQALAMQHGPFSERLAESLANRLVIGESEAVARVELAYRLLFAREPSPSELSTVSRFVDDIRTRLLAAKGTSATDTDRLAATREAWRHTALVLLNSNEFLYVH